VPLASEAGSPQTRRTSCVFPMRNTCRVRGPCADHAPRCSRQRRKACARLLTLPQNLRAPAWRPNRHGRTWNEGGDRVRVTHRRFGATAFARTLGVFRRSCARPPPDSQPRAAGPRLRIHLPLRAWIATYSEYPYFSHQAATFVGWDDLNRDDRTRSPRGHGGASTRACKRSRGVHLGAWPNSGDGNRTGGSELRRH
jgi:hypothetical protein